MRIAGWVVRTFGKIQVRALRSKLGNWLLSRWPHPRPRARRRRPRRLYVASIDVLEDRRLLSVTSVDSSTSASAATAAATVVNQSVFYNNSQFDVHDPAANAADDAAIATDKSALLPGHTATFANYTSFSKGINGIMVDIAGLPSAPTASDFLFRVGSDSDSSAWSTAPAPAAIAVRWGAGVGGSDRVTITWSDDVIRNEWLQVVILARADTGLQEPFIFYFGNLVGDGAGSTGESTFVNATDEIITRNQPFTITNPAPITAPADYNRDGLINATDELIARDNVGTQLQLITADPAFVKASVAGQHVFYNDSSFDGNDPTANASDDNAIAPDKTALLPGGIAGPANYTNYSRGINGIMIDIAGLPAAPTASDFLFAVGNDNNSSAWSDAPAPSTVSVRWGAGAGGSDRVTITWQDAAIRNEWLQVVVLARVDTGLQEPYIFYFGNLVGDGSASTSGWTVVTSSDLTATRNQHFTLANPAPITVPADYNRDGLINATDEVIARDNGGTSLQFISPSDGIAPASDPTSPSPSGPLFQTAYTDFISAGRDASIGTQVVGRLIFYNNSHFDGNDPTANSVDDKAIATDKTALLAGRNPEFCECDQL